MALDLYLVLPEVNMQVFSSQIVEKGLRLGDEMVIKPFMGNKRVIKIFRTKTEFKIHEEFLNQGDYIQLPSLDDRGSLFQLSLQKISSDENEGRFIFESIGGIPFKLNGNLVFKAYVERGDRISLGQNLIQFGHEYEKHTEEIPLNSKVIHSDLKILIEGETGTGKSFLAEKIHKESGRSGPFVQININSFSPGLLESELFGHVRGAFTGATQEKPGAFIMANHGTLFIDEIDSLPLELQTKLLLFLDSHKVRPVGAHYEFKVNTRLIFASGRKLSHLVEKGTFRKDFYYRLSTGALIHLKPLRHDPMKIKKIIQQFSIDQDVTFAPKLLEFLTGIPWPGNIRELLGYLERKKAYARSRKIDFDECDEALIRMSSDLSHLCPQDSLMTLDLLKRRYIQNTLVSLNWNKKKVAQVLGISDKTLNRVIKEGFDVSLSA
jgi:transcriptional regulator with GAF, ATPase, and Fis domain